MGVLGASGNDPALRIAGLAMRRLSAMEPPFGDDRESKRVALLFRRIAKCENGMNMVFFGEEGHGHKVAWIMPPLMTGSGGINTILRNAEALVREGCQCDFVFPPSSSGFMSEEAIREVISGCYRYKHSYRVFPFADDVDASYDVVVATFWETARFASLQNAPYKIYFVQDWEPWFYPVGYASLEAENSYSLGFHSITIGRWLAERCKSRCLSSWSTDFCADSAVYRALDLGKERAVCAIYQPEKPRRASELLLRALRIVKALDPDLKVYLYGSEARAGAEGFVNLGILPIEACNELYNRCLCGVSISLSNPSRIPFEMMAAGLPVVDVYGEQTLYDLPEEACLLALPDAASIATAILRIVKDPSLRRGMSSAALEFMADRPIEKEGAQFAEACFNVIGGVEPACRSCVEKRMAPPVRHGEEEKKILSKMDADLLESMRIEFSPLAAGDHFVSLYSEKKLEEARLAFWSKDNQEDLIWVDLSGDASGSSWCARASLICDFGCRVVYHLHFYGSSESEKNRFIGGVDRVVLNDESASDRVLTACSIDLGECSVEMSLAPGFGEEGLVQAEGRKGGLLCRLVGRFLKG